MQEASAAVSAHVALERRNRRIGWRTVMPSFASGREPAKLGRAAELDVGLVVLRADGRDRTEAFGREREASNDRDEPRVARQRRAHAKDVEHPEWRLECP